MSKPQTDTARMADHWVGDLLGRRRDSYFLKQFLISRVREKKERGAKGSYVLNIDASWGQGKTYFIQRFLRDLAEDHTVAYVNAWEDDYADDPLVAIMAAVSDSLPKSKKTVSGKSVTATVKEVAVIAAKYAVLTAGKRLIGEGVEALGETLGQVSQDGGDVTNEAFKDVVTRRADAAIAKFTEAKRSVANFKQALASLLGRDDVKKPLFILVDELDRCRPTYAIALLERVKHLFDVDDVVFVIATDTSQLRHSITAVYGQGFDGAGYLLRFFDRTYRFAKPNVTDFVRSLFAEHGVDVSKLSSPDMDDHADFFTRMAVMYQLSPREIKRCFDIMRSALTNWQHAVRIELLLLLPVVVAQCRGDLDELANLSKMQSQFLAASPSANAMELTFQKFKPRGQRVEPVKLAALWTYFSEVSRRPLHDISSLNRADGYRDWVQERFKEEFRLLHNNTYDSSNPPRTVCRQYVELVRSVGRLSQPDTT